MCYLVTPFITSSGFQKFRLFSSMSQSSEGEGKGMCAFVIFNWQWLTSTVKEEQ